MDLDKAIVIESPLVIKQYLEPISEEITKMVNVALEKVKNATDDDKQELKQTRSELNKIKSTLEDKRKQVKQAVTEPYQQFEGIYTDLIKNRLTTADNELKQAIDNIEIKQKNEKEQELREFFEQYREHYHVEDIINFEDVGLNITLSASMKSLKDHIISFCEKISEDLVAISSHEEREQVLYEYKANHFDYTKAINSFNAKQEELNRLKQKLEDNKKIEEVEVKVIENVNTLVSAPVEIESKLEEETLTVAFQVKATREQIRELKNYMNEKGIIYE